MPASKTTFTTIRTEGALLPPDLLQRIAEGATIEGLRPESYHRPGEKLNEVINRAWNVLQGTWASFRAAQEKLPSSDLGTSLTRERWLLPLFRELDYGRLPTTPTVVIDGRSYPISHGWENIPIHLVSYQVDLDKRTPGVAGAAAASPHSLLQVFLNRSEDKLWGFVSNGYKLRILRDNASLTRQAYVEFDLEAMMEGEVYSDFVLLWLLAHQSRVEGGRDCWLEKWMKVAEEQGTRALDHLRVGVEQAITALGSGFLERAENGALRDGLTNGRLDKQDYYRQLLRLVYRLLFLFVAEDRGVLYDPELPEASREIYRKYYSTQRLRRMAESFKGTNHPDLYVGLRLVMQALGGDETGDNAPTQSERAQRLGLPTLGSYLFSDEAVADVIGCQISNRNLLDAVRALSLVYDDKVKVYRGIDYKNLGPEELGSVYESLLELHPQINVPARSFALATAGGNERKTTGSYYTPTSLINALLDSALNPVLDEAVRKPNPEHAVLGLKVCDPACGSGHFLIAAANRMAKALASIRTGEEEPPPSAIQQAKRDVIGHCIYGVDINPMAVELCKVNLWMEALEPGKPLSFLDHRIQVGNSLLGTTPRLMAEGIPSDAFSPIEGDDKAVVSKLRKQNAQERKDYESGQRSLFDVIEPPADYRRIAADLRDLDALDDATMAGIRAKEERFKALANDAEVQKARGLADAWCAAFVWEKTTANPLPPMTDRAYRLLSKDPLDPRFEDVRSYVAQLGERYQFFHWHVSFPDVFRVADDASVVNEQTGWEGGFNVVLGNPPWDQIQLDPREFFEAFAPEVAEVKNASLRNKAIEQLSTINPLLYASYMEELQKKEGVQHFIHDSGRYPLTSFGRLNSAPLFSETSLIIQSGLGYSGIIVPTGIATDSFTQHFFRYLITSKRLARLWGFENEEFLFPGVHHSMKFCLLTLNGTQLSTDKIDFTFFARSIEALDDDERHFTLSAEDIALLNPSTFTSPIFRSNRDAEITKAVYRKLPVLVPDNDGSNSWHIEFKLMFMMNTASHLFRTQADLHSQGCIEKSNNYIGVSENDIFLPLYEGKLMHFFDHRYTTYEGATEANLNAGILPQVSSSQKQNPYFSVLPRYWINSEEVYAQLNEWKHHWLICFRNIARTTDERTAIFGLIPLVGVGNSAPIIFPNFGDARYISCIFSNFSSFCYDYITRQKLGGITFNFYIVEQIPIIPPHTYIPVLLDFIVPRVLELTYTAWDLQPFAQDVGYDGAPFVWDEERRFLMRCELDALYFHLYQIARDDVDYILETFPIVKRKDEAAHGEYLTKRIILEMYDQMVALPQISVPAPKGEGDYRVPDVAQWVTWLEPEPASPLVAHIDTRGD